MSEELNLERMKERLLTVTAGPWVSDNYRVYAGGHDYERCLIDTKHQPFYNERSSEEADQSADMRFVAAARQDIPALIAEIEQLRAALGSRGVQEEPLAVRVVNYLLEIDDPYESFEGNAEACRFCFARRGNPHNDCVWEQVKMLPAALRGVGTPPCQTCQGRGCVMKSEHHDLGNGLSSGGMWNEPCPDCASNQCQKPAVGLGTPHQEEKAP